VQLLKRVREGTLAPDELSRHQRRVCVAYLRLEGYTQEEIAEIFGVHRHTIARDEKANRAEMARLVDELDVRAVAGSLIASGTHLRAKAIREKDYALAWRIERELVADLQSLGYLPKAAEQHEVRIATFADLAKLALEPLALDENSPRAVEALDEGPALIEAPVEAVAGDDLDVADWTDVQHGVEGRPPSQADLPCDIVETERRVSTTRDDA
jgi:transcriptional regulator with XRE-family HTH domain